MTAKGRLNTAWIFSLLLVLTLAASLGHIHDDDMHAELCAVCTFGDQSPMLTAPAGQPLIADNANDSMLPCIGSAVPALLHAYLSRAPPLA